jgi:hypothetical protein
MVQGSLCMLCVLTRINFWLDYKCLVLRQWWNKSLWRNDRHQITGSAIMAMNCHNWRRRNRIHIDFEEYFLLRCISPSSVEVHRSFGGLYCLHIQGRSEASQETCNRHWALVGFLIVLPFDIEDGAVYSCKTSVNFYGTSWHPMLEIGPYIATTARTSDPKHKPWLCTKVTLRLLSWSLQHACEVFLKHHVCVF